MNWQRAPLEVPAATVSEVVVGVPRPLGELFHLHFDDVYRFCLLRSGSASRAEDAASDTFADAARLFAANRGAEVTVGWLFTVARHRLIDQWRTSERERRRLERIIAQPNDDQGDITMREDDVVLTALAGLPDTQRAALVLRYVDGYSVSEVSDALGVSYRATESILARGRRGFKRAYREASR